ncbi:glycosyltransferase family 2 protein [Phenylobacterium soli]|uniref:Glycosyltransferase family 2 protein n=1 Tax=Phenylobacterium soli TaxID=2170551 RepID=A0A328AJM7_9CAUL|nr:glycosyltransferase family 2 protein [Phenylobacterium soli]RAK53078.1 glycosyltransferase family 2 protein [Phenylobacterium soli]
MALPPPLSLGCYFPDDQPPQTPADIGVIMPTLLRPSIVRAVRCVFGQLGAGRIQLVIGADVNFQNTGELYAALAERPAHISAVVLTLPYSTSIRHGGVHRAVDGGALRSILSYVANSRAVAYLDDDNLWERDHLASLAQAMNGKAWAYSQRMLVDEETGRDVSVDRWDSVGLDKGRFAAEGGFVDTNCLLVDKLAAADAFGLWSEPGLNRASQRADRRFFRALRDLPHGVVDRPTVRYGIRPTNILWKYVRGEASL